MRMGIRPIRRRPRISKLKRRTSSRGPKEEAMVTMEGKVEAKDRVMDFIHTLTVSSTRGSKSMAPTGITRPMHCSVQC